MQFKDIIGQQPVKEQLVQLVQQNRLSHALLFLGKEGSGALSLAIAFAQYIVCTSAKEAAQKSAPGLFGEAPSSPSPLRGEGKGEGDSCGTCSACTKADKLIHPDIHFSYPVVTKKPGEKPVSTDYISEWREFVCGYPYGNIYDWLQFIGAENKQGNITAQECNEINHKLSLKAFESQYKILIMWMPEFLGKEGNKLLKLIEEPPPDTLFIFVAEDESAILPTILSRTQLVKIPALTDDEIEDALITRGKVENNKARQIAGVCAGNYRESLQMLQHAEEDWQSLLREWLNAIAKNNTAAQIKWIDEITRLGREKQKQFLRYFIHLLEQAVRVRMIEEGTGLKNPFSNMPEKEKDFAIRLNKLCSLSAQQAIITELDKATYYIERNAHAKMLFHALCIRLYHIIKDNSLILVN
ncbi:MAG: polymerase gamma/tau subunit-like protein [Chitinophagaceae bacterium]|nr:polymerase gamma/tau subunit-like protein [Chitinophagaceae bacterium]